MKDFVDEAVLETMFPDGAEVLEDDAVQHRVGKVEQPARRVVHVEAVVDEVPRGSTISERRVTGRE